MPAKAIACKSDTGSAIENAPFRSTPGMGWLPDVRGLERPQRPLSRL